ncbi:CapA family protein [bacterium]|nr:CapA family protein [bacterium]
MTARGKRALFTAGCLAALLFGAGLHRSYTRTPDRQTLTIAFTGDIMLGRQVGRAIFRANDPSLPFRHIYSEIRPADIAIGNLECVFADTLFTGTFNHPVIRFPAYSETVAGLKLAGFDCCSVANNHALDFGTPGVRKTIQILDRNGIVPMGTASANPVVIAKKGYTVALFGFWAKGDTLWAVDPSGGYAGVEDETVLDAIGQAKKTCDIVILFLHWGKEYTGSPTDEQKNLARRASQAGADLIVGHGPHQIQEIEYRGKSLIAYSLGNCVFDQKYDETRTGLILRVSFDSPGAVPKAVLIPVRTDDSTCAPVVLTGSEKERVLFKLTTPKESAENKRMADTE